VRRTPLLIVLLLVAGLIVALVSARLLTATVTSDPLETATAFIRERLSLTADACPGGMQQLAFFHDLFQAKEFTQDPAFDVNGKNGVTEMDGLVFAQAMYGIVLSCGQGPSGCVVDGILSTLEECDDGNSTDDDGCTACKIDQGYVCVDPRGPDRPSVCQKCGNGVKEGTEQCDPDPLQGSASDCTPTCTFPVCDAKFAVHPTDWNTNSTPPACATNGFGKVSLPGTLSTAELMDLNKDGKPDIAGIADIIHTYLNVGGLKFEKIILGNNLEEWRTRLMLMMKFTNLNETGRQDMLQSMQDTILCFQRQHPRTSATDALLYRYQVVFNFMQMDDTAREIELRTLENQIKDLEMVGESNKTNIGHSPVARAYDLDSDGDQDILIMSKRTTGGDILTTNLTRCINTAGSFRCGAAGGMYWPWFTAVQLDADPQLEIVVPALDHVEYSDALAPIGSAGTVFRLSDIPFYGTPIPGLTTFSASAVGDKLYNGSVMFDVHQTCMLFGKPNGRAGCIAPSQGTEDLIRVADFDGDHKDDFVAVVSENGARDLSLRLNGDRTLGRVPGPESSFTGGRETWVVPVDMDRDGDLDIAGIAQSAIAITQPAWQTVFWMENRGSAPWSEHVIAENSGAFNVTGGTFRAADLDGDGLPELFAPGLKGGIFTRSCTH